MQQHRSMLPETCPALAGVGVKERVIEEAMHRLRALAMCHQGPGVHCWYVASFKGVPMLRSYWRGAALQLLVMRGPAIGRLSHAILVKTHCHMPYLRASKGAINVLPTTLILLAARELLQLCSRPAAAPTLGFLTFVLSSLP